MYLVYPSHKILSSIDSDDILKKIELFARTCYKSENKITELSNKKFVSNIIKNGHLSVIEHINITVKIICDRGVLNEIVRHRLCSYSVESSRYCNYKNGVTFIIPPWFPREYFTEGDYGSKVMNPFMENGLSSDIDIWLSSMYQAEQSYIALLNKKWTPQEARCVLPNSLKTEIIMTTNLREWRHILKLRTSKAAHPQIREIMIPILKEFQEKIPIIFDDITWL